MSTSVPKTGVLIPQSSIHNMMAGMPETDLPTLVRDLMTVGVLTCNPQTKVPELAQMLLEHDLDEVIVLDEGKALGVVGQDELVSAFTRDGYKDLTALEVMREGVAQVPPEIPLTAAAQLMQDQGVRTFFLMHHAAGIEYPAAAISYKHLLRLLAADSLDDLSDLGIRADRVAPLDEFIQRREETKKKNIEFDDR
ncbi:MAG: CBS domain-containing protein [Anaerolineales bacterium]|nr:CBS domain-containing protein [Anaerolineales bacterium]